MDSLIVECSAAFPSSVLVKVLPSLQDSPGYFCKQTSPVKKPKKRSTIMDPNKEKITT
jgi:hypothetical protein